MASASVDGDVGGLLGGDAFDFQSHFLGSGQNGTNLRRIWDGFCGLKFSSRGVVL
jgi:hypothetical protein